ncbi:MAG TPA: fluoride efflux transporter CrcB [Usitatibacteraceae bacterium]|nr:fluoride efflux transporter CrcB [Usitatibacteraceae bacterium]
MHPVQIGWGLLSVGVGSALGGMARWGLSVWLNARHPTFFWGTFVANALGGLLIGMAVAWFARDPDISHELRLFLITGFLGGLTTFSTYSSEVIGLIQRGEPGWATLVAVSHLAISLLLTALGYWLVK